MSDWVAALQALEARLSERKGEFALFAALLPAGAADQWDLVVSAPWARRDDRAVLDLIRDELAETLNERDRLLLARIVVVEPWHVDVQEINARIDVAHGFVSVANEEHFGYVAERGFVVTSKDYWRFIKRLFPHNAEFVFFSRDGDLLIRISWYLNDAPGRPHKRSRNIILAISEEALEDYLYVDHPDRHEAEEKLAAFVIDRLKRFDPRHDVPAHATPPREQWRVTTALFRRPRLAVG
jgi:hypothetical protein